jgi:hypothetical protein
MVSIQFVESILTFQGVMNVISSYRRNLKYQRTYFPCEYGKSLIQHEITTPPVTPRRNGQIT